MGAKSTLRISRKTAVSYVASKLYACTDQELEDMMETLYGDQLLYNYHIESSDEEGFPYDSHDEMTGRGREIFG
jgi:hypothetical protein